MPTRYKDKLTKKYLQENYPKKSAGEIARLFGATTRTVYYHLEKYGIPRERNANAKNHKRVEPGQRFGKLVVVEKEKTRKNGEIVWRCECDCGGFSSTGSADLNRGVVSCGCRAFTGYKELSGARFSQIKGSAGRRRKVYFDEENITPKYLYELFIRQDKKCAITGQDIDLTNNASLDRIDSSKGYVDGNLQWVTKEINTMKWDFTQERFVELCEMVVANKEKIKNGR